MYSLLLFTAQMAPVDYFEIILAVLCFLFLWSLRQDNTLPWNWPLVGMLPRLLLFVNQIHQTCTDILGQTGGTFLFKGPWFINMDMLATVDPANIHYIMSENFSNFPKGPQFKNIFDVLGDGIFNSDGDLWRTQRKLARNLINHKRFHLFLAKTSRDKVENGLIPVLEHVSNQGLIVDMQDIFQRFTFDTTCMLVTGYDPGCLSIDFPDVPFSRAMDDAEEVIFMRHVTPECVWKLQRWLKIGAEKKLSEAWEILDCVIGKYISMKQKELTEKIELNKDLEGVDLLTSYINEDDETMGLKRNNKFLRDTILNLMIAGRDTTSSSLTWFLWLVSMHPQVELKIREELRANIPEKEAENLRIFSVDEVSNMVYLHGALCEALRLYPPVPFQHKSPVKSDILPSGHKVHPKMKVMFSLYAMGRMVSIWGKDCLEFKPERWITERGTIKHEPSYKFLAFNAGPRTCLGKEVAFTQTKAVAAAIMHNYHVQVMEGQVVAPNVSVILYMKYGLMARIAKRWS